jgi:hypothetical protein
MSYHSEMGDISLYVGLASPVLRDVAVVMVIRAAMVMKMTMEVVTVVTVAMVVKVVMVIVMLETVNVETMDLHHVRPCLHHCGSTECGM